MNQKQINIEDFFSVKGNKITKKENKEIEFKESFQSPKYKDKKILKWISSFANAQGGLIVYGVNNSNEIIGLKDDRFVKADTKDFTEELSNFFMPEIVFDLFSQNINGIDLGFLYIYESKNKPVIAIKDSDIFNEGDIFYRYSGQSTKIKYAELKLIIENKIETLNNNWIKLLQNIATVGVENIGVLNVLNGEIIGNERKLFIDKNLIPQLKFINEGHFVEKEGAPTLTLIGKVESIDLDNNKVIKVVETKISVINHHDIYQTFFKQEIDKDCAKQYLKQIISESSVYLPFYFYIFNAEMNISEFLKFIEDSKGLRRNEIIKRIEGEKKDNHKLRNGHLDTATDAAKSIKGYYSQILKNEVINLENIEDLKIRHILQAVTHLKESEINISYICNLLENIYDLYYEKNSISKGFIKKAICHIDLVVYGKQIFTKVKSKQ